MDKEYLEELLNAELFLKQEKQLYYQIEIHSPKGYSQPVGLRSDFLGEALAAQIQELKNRVGAKSARV